MQVGVGSGSTTNSGGGGASGRSVGQRIKEASLKEFQLNTYSNNNNNGNDEENNVDNLHNNATSTSLVGLGANNSSNGTTTAGGRTMRTAALCASSDFDSKTRRSTAIEPVILSEVQRNTIRVIGQYLRDLGMNDTVDSLVEESGCRIENALAIRLQEYVLVGAWRKALAVLEKFRGAMTERQYLTIRVLLLEERFKQFIANNELLAALHLLQMDYPKESIFKARCEHLATSLMTIPILTSETCENDGFYAFDSNSSAVTGCQIFDGDVQNGNAQNGNSVAHQRIAMVNQTNSSSNNNDNELVLKTLQKMLPSAFLLPPKRLDSLLEQAWKYQVRECDLHIASSKDEVLDSRSILRNHECKPSEFPTKNIQVLHDHQAEVWCLEFSPSGQFLASGAKSNAILIWEVNTNTYQLSLFRRFTVPTEISGISSISWSADSRLLAVASSEENAGPVYVFNVQTGAPAYEHQPSAVSSFSVVSFFKHPHSRRLACGDQKGHFHVFDVDQPNIKFFEGFRIRCLYSMKDGKTVLAADTHNRIRSYDFDAMQETTIIQETSPIVFFSVDAQERYCLVTTKTEGIRLWSLKTKNLVRSFFGSMHHDFVISTCFGGEDENFIVSGSEDENIVIWNIARSEPVKYLTNHTSTVNAVSWNPVLNGMMVSGSDDCTIRVWAATRKLSQQQQNDNQH